MTALVYGKTSARRSTGFLSQRLRGLLIAFGISIVLWAGIIQGSMKLYGLLVS